LTVRFDARRLPKQPGPAAWNALLPPQPSASMLQEDVTADFAVIGAGFAGLSAARRLAQIAPGARIVVLEAGRVAEGPAGRNSGFMIDLPHDLSSSDYAGKGVDSDSIQTDLNRRAIRFAKEAAVEIGLGRESFDPCGKVNAAATEAGHRHNLAYAAHLGRIGEDHSLFDAKDMRALTGTDYYRSGLFTPGTVMLQPAAYIRGLAGTLGEAVSLYENSAVRSIAQTGRDWLLNCANGSVTAARVILATNGHAESFGFFAGRLLHVFTYASMTEPINPSTASQLGGAPTWAVTPADPMGSTIRRISTGKGDRIVVRSRFTCNPSMQVGDRVIEAAGRLHDRGFKARFPMLERTRMQYRWAGHLCLSRNGVPAFGEVADGIYAACCQNGLGTAKGTLSGMAAAELATDHRSRTVEALLQHAPPSRLPPAPLTWIGANAVMRWKEWKAGREC